MTQKPETYRVLMPIKTGHHPKQECIESIKSQTINTELIAMINKDQVSTMHKLYSSFLYLYPDDEFVFFACCDYKILHKFTFFDMLEEMICNDKIGMLCLQKNDTINRVLKHVDIGVHCVRRSAIPDMSKVPIGSHVCKHMQKLVEDADFSVQYFRPGVQTMEQIEPIKCW